MHCILCLSTRVAVQISQGYYIRTMLIISCVVGMLHTEVSTPLILEIWEHDPGVRGIDILEGGW